MRSVTLSVGSTYTRLSELLATAGITGAPTNADVTANGFIRNTDATLSIYVAAGYLTAPASAIGEVGANDVMLFNGSDFNSNECWIRSESGTVQIDFVTGSQGYQQPGPQGQAGPAGGGTVTNVSSANGALSVATPTTTPVLTVNSAPTLSIARTIGGVSFNGSANIVPQTIQSVNEASDTTCFPLFISASGSQSLQPLNNAGFIYNASANSLTATTFIGALTGTASGNLVSGGALGTPSSGNLSNCTSLPISTGVSGLGTGVATFLTTPSSANLASAVTDETGTGALVFANTPTLVTPILGTPTSGNLANCTFPTLNQNTTGYASALKSATTTVDVASSVAPTTGYVLTATDSTHATWQAAAGGVPTQITVANEATDTTCFLGFFTAATGDLGPKTNANLTFNSNTGVVTLVAPVLGTPTSGVLTNCTGLPQASVVGLTTADTAKFTGEILSYNNSSTSVWSSAGNLILRNNNATTNTWGGIEFDDAAAVITSGISSTCYDQTNHYGRIDFATRGAGGFNATVMSLKDGKVGIGTITPSTALEVSGTVTATAFVGSLAGSTGLLATGGGTGQSTYTKGDIIVPGSNTLNKLAVGADGFALIADAASTNGVKWAAVAGTGTVTSVTSANAAITVATTTTTPVLTLVYSPALKSATTTVDVSASTAPSTGYILTATDSTHATWQAPTGGGNVSNTGTPTSGQAAEWTSATVIQGVAVTGTVNYVKSNSPTLVTPILGVASATSLATSAASPLLLTNGQLVTIALTSQTVGGATLTIPDFANVSDEFTFKTKSQTMSNKTFVAPLLGTPTSGVLTNCTGTASGLTAGTATALANARTIGGVSFDGTANITVATATGGFTVSGGNLDVSARNIVTDTSTGTKFGTATNQKLGFFNSAPIVQPTGDVITGLQNLGLMASATIAATTITSRTLWGQTYDGSANVTGSLTAVADITGGASSMTLTAGTGNSRTLTLRSTTSGGTVTAFLTGNADQSSTFGGNISGTGAWTLTGGAGNMTIVAGTGASRTMILQTTTSGSTATTALTLNADQSATFAAGITASGAMTIGTGNAFTCGTIELGNASNTTISQSSAGVIAVEGSIVPTVGATNTWTGVQTIPQVIASNNAITASGNAATVPVTSKVNTVTNNSAATLTITLTTSGAVNRQVVCVCILDSSAAAQTITWVNTENSTVSAPTTSNGSTTLPLTVLFMLNSATGKWRCIAVA